MQPTTGIFSANPIALDSGARYALVDGVPVLHEDKPVGAVALVYPIDPTYLEHLKKLLDADLALSINGKLTASTKGHPAADLRSAREEVVFQEDHEHLFALETFHLRSLRLLKRFGACFAA